MTHGTSKTQELTSKQSTNIFLLTTPMISKYTGRYILFDMAFLVRY